MPDSLTKSYSTEELFAEALRYLTPIDFARGSKNHYQVAVKRVDYNEMCSHMKKTSFSSPEKALLEEVLKFFGDARKYRSTKVRIDNKAHIKGFEIDIFIPSLNLGVEFDGTYWHSFEGLRRSRKHWPTDDICNYHQLKDAWFSSKGIQILHIKEEDWIIDKEECILKIEKFLGITNFMSETNKKVA